MNKYLEAHIWIHNNYTKTDFCEQCFMQAKTEWSNKSGEYRQERGDWQELCPTCHRQYDQQSHMQGASHKAGMPKRNFFHIHLSEHDKTRANNIMRLLRPYKDNHSLHSVFEALAEIVEKEAAAKRPK